MCYNCKKCTALLPCEECTLWPPEHWETLAKRAERRSRSRERKIRGGLFPLRRPGRLLRPGRLPPLDPRVPSPMPLASPAAPPQPPSDIPPIPPLSTNDSTISISSLLDLFNTKFTEMSSSISCLSQRIDSVQQVQVATRERSTSGSPFEGFPSEENGPETDGGRLDPPQARAVTSQAASGPIRPRSWQLPKRAVVILSWLPGHKVTDRATQLYKPVTGHQSSGQPVNRAANQPVTSQRVRSSQPVTSQRVTSQPVTSHPVAGQPVTGHPATGHPVTGQPVSSQPVTKQPVSRSPSNRSPVRQTPVNRSPVNQSLVNRSPGQQIAGQPVTGQPVTGQPVAGQQPVTSRPVNRSPVNRSRVIQVTGHPDEAQRQPVRGHHRDLQRATPKAWNLR